MLSRVLTVLIGRTSENTLSGRVLRVSPWFFGTLFNTDFGRVISIRSDSINSDFRAASNTSSRYFVRVSVQVDRAVENTAFGVIVCVVILSSRVDGTQLDAFSGCDSSCGDVTCPVISWACEYTAVSCVVCEQIWKCWACLDAPVCAVVRPFWDLAVAFLYAPSRVYVGEFVSWTVLNAHS